MNLIKYFIMTTLIAPIAGIATSSEYVSGRASINETKLYAGAREASPAYLIDRDAKIWLKRFHGNKALDYGSGLGISAVFLKQHNFDVTGVDVNEHSIAVAQSSYPDIKFVHMQKNHIPFADKSFDLVYSSLVLFELSSIEDIKQYLTEARRVLKDDGYIIAATGSVHLADRNYKSAYYNCDFPENDNATSGCVIKVGLQKSDLIFNDYFWTETDYLQAFADSGLHLCQIHYPLGANDLGYEWQDETSRSPFIMFLAQKYPCS